jgi:uncharacterized protein (TIGR03086 family)
MIDLAPAATRVARVLAAVDDTQLGLPTPCGTSSVGDVIDHVGTMATAFTSKASKDADGPAFDGAPPPPSAANLGDQWRTEIAERLRTLAAAWAVPSAWEGMTKAGGVDLPSEVAGLVVLDELVIHGWDVATATGVDYDVPEDEVQATTAFVTSFDAPRDGALFGPVVPVSDTAPAFDRLLGLTGRDPGWKPPG